MDSVTQITLGAAVGEAFLGRKVGNKAPLAGAVAGTIPDLDVLFNPLLDPVQQLVFHRGFSHSLLFAILFAVVMGRMMVRIPWFREATVREWGWLYFWGVFTHIVLDCLTTYGTGVFEPFSHYRVEYSSIFIIDPMFTLPLLLCLLVAMFYARNTRKRRILNTAGLAFSSAYLLLSMGCKVYAQQVFTAELERQKHPFSDIMVVPTPFNNLLWHAIAYSDDGYWVAYYSLLDESPEIDFRFVPRNAELLAPFRDSEAVQRLRWFSKGYYRVTVRNGALIFNDIRFGQLDGWESQGDDYVFMFEIIQQPDGTIGIVPRRPDFELSGENFSRLFERVKGIDAGVPTIQE